MNIEHKYLILLYINLLEEEREEVILSLMDRIADEITFNKGYYISAYGGEVILEFGYPVSHDDDFIRAVNAGLSIHADFPSTRMFIDEGYLTVYNLKLYRYFTGEPIDRIRAYSDEVKDSGVYLKSSFRKILKYRYHYEKKGKFIKIISRVGKYRRKQTEFFIGRERELIKIKGRLKRFKFLNIYGEAGIGKTRLVEEFIIREESKGKKYLWVNGDRGTSYNFLYTVLKNLWDISENMDRQLLRKRLEMLFGVYSEEILSLYSDSSVNADKNVVYIALMNLLKKTDIDYIIIDMWDLLDRNSMDFIEAVRNNINNINKFFILIAQKPFGGVENIILNPLNANDSGALIRYFLGNDVSSDVIQEIIFHADGNPLFIEELCYEYRENGKIIPSSKLYSVINSRLDRLNDREKEFLRYLSLMKETSIYLVKNVFNVDSIDAIIDNLLRKDLIDIDEATKEMYFKHPLIKEVVYESLSEIARKRINLRIAEVMEQDYRYHAPRFYSIIGDYFWAGENYSKGMKYLRLAIDHKIKINDYIGAILYIDRLFTYSGKRAFILKQLTYFSLKKIELLLRIEKFEEAGKLFERIEVRDVDVAWYNLLKGKYLLSNNRIEEAFHYLSRSYKLIKTLPKPVLAAELLLFIGLYYEKKNEQDKALKYLRLSGNMFKEAANIEGIITSMYNIALIYMKQNAFDKAVDICRLSLDITVKNKNTVAFLSIYLLLGEIYLKQKRYFLSIENLNKAFRIVEKLSVPHYQIRIVFALAKLLYAKKWYRNAYKLLSIIENLSVKERKLIEVLFMKAYIELYAKDAIKGLNSLKKALQLALKTNDEEYISITKSKIKKILKEVR